MRARWLLLTLSLTPLGCPLLLDDDFSIVDAESIEGGAGGDGGVEDPPARAGAHSTPPCPPGCDSCDGPLCVLACRGKEACKEAMLACPESHECRVVCAGKSACAKLRLVCPKSRACVIECAEAEDACKDMSVTCGTSRCEAECHAPAEGPALQCGKSTACVSCP